MAAAPYKAAMSLSLSVPTSLEYFASLVQSDDHFPLLEAAASLAQDEYPEFDVQQLLGDELYWDVVLVLRKEEVPALCLGADSRIGWTSWVGQQVRTRDAADVRMDSGAHAVPA